MSKRSELRRQDLVRRSLEKTLRVQLVREFRILIYQIKKAGDAHTAIWGHEDRLRGLLFAFYIKAFRMAGNKMRPELKSLGYLNLEFKDDSFELAASEFAGKWSGLKVTEISDSTRKRINKAIQRNAETSGSTADLVNELRRYVGGARATTIARTESQAAAQAGQLEVAKNVGVVLKKVWVSAEDDRTRPAHNEADGQTVDLDEPFIVDGEELMFPGDPSGSAANIINCRCAVVYKVK